MTLILWLHGILTTSLLFIAWKSRTFAFVNISSEIFWNEFKSWNSRNLLQSILASIFIFFSIDGSALIAKWFSVCVCVCVWRFMTTKFNTIEYDGGAIHSFIHFLTSILVLSSSVCACGICNLHRIPHHMKSVLNIRRSQLDGSFVRKIFFWKKKKIVIYCK